MSESTPNVPSSESTASPAAETFRRRRGDRQPGWVLLSLLLHALVLGALMLHTPTREALLGRDKPEARAEVRAEGEELADLVEKVRDINREELLQRTAELEQIKQEMQRIEQVKLEEFRELNQERAATAPQDAAEAIRKALEEQQAAAEAQRKAADPEQRATELGNAARAQSAAEVAQDEATQLLEIAGPAVPQEVRAAQAAAAEAQRKATLANAQAKRAADAALDAAGRARRVAEELDRARDAAEKRRQERDAAARQLEERQAAREQVEARDVPEAAADADKKAREEAKKAAENKRRDLDRTAKAVRDQQNDLDKRQRALDAAEKSVADKQASADAATRRAEQVARDAAEKTVAADAAQREAIQQQQRAAAALGEALSKPQDAAAEPRLADDTAPTPSDTPPTDLFDADLPELYQCAKEAERQIAASFREARAAELAMITETSLGAARRSADVPEPVRPELDSELLRKKVEKSGDFRQHQEQVETALRESGSMIANSRTMMETAAAMVRKGEEGTPIALADIEAEARRQAQLATGAHEEAGGKATDLAALMGGEAAPPAEGAAAQAGNGHNAGAGAGGEKGGVGQAGLPTRMAPPSLEGIGKSVPARRFAASGPAADWAFIDSWYTIGPFDNPARANIHREFPPQSLVDLDAVYTGMGGQRIRWTHTQSTEPLIVPDNVVEYGIWYAYTELHFDEAIDTWIAVGSDDRSDIWINGMKVWSSSDSLKSWRIGEGLRRVHFQKGINRILYRIENGHHALGFSMCVHLPKGP